MSVTAALLKAVAIKPGVTGDELKAALSKKAARGVIDNKLTVLVELGIIERRRPSAFQAGEYHPRNKRFLREFLGIAKPTDSL